MPVTAPLCWLCFQTCFAMSTFQQPFFLFKATFEILRGSRVLRKNNLNSNFDFPGRNLIPAIQIKTHMPCDCVGAVSKMLRKMHQSLLKTKQKNVSRLVGTGGFYPACTGKYRKATGRLKHLSEITVLFPMFWPSPKSPLLTHELEHAPSMFMSTAPLGEKHVRIRGNQQDCTGTRQNWCVDWTAFPFWSSLCQTKEPLVFGRAGMCMRIYGDSYSKLTRVCLYSCGDLFWFLHLKKIY